MAGEKSDILHGTLALMILRTLDVLGPMHGYGLARRIEQVSRGVLELNQGTLYPALLTLQQAGWIASKWGLSDTGRKAKFYSITRSGKKQLNAEAENWRRIADVIERFAEPEGRGL
jgi:PadR family transcriptional regulator